MSDFAHFLCVPAPSRSHTCKSVVPFVGQQWAKVCLGASCCSQRPVLNIEKKKKILCPFISTLATCSFVAPLLTGVATHSHKGQRRFFCRSVSKDAAAASPAWNGRGAAEPACKSVYVVRRRIPRGEEWGGNQKAALQWEGNWRHGGFIAKLHLNTTNGRRWSLAAFIQSDAWACPEHIPKKKKNLTRGCCPDMLPNFTFSCYCTTSWHRELPLGHDKFVFISVSLSSWVSSGVFSEISVLKFRLRWNFHRVHHLLNIWSKGVSLHFLSATIALILPNSSAP